jgi:hypothetical protein
MPTRPNILLLFTDQQRHDTIAALGNPVTQTPAPDSLVREGVEDYEHLAMAKGANCRRGQAKDRDVQDRVRAELLEALAGLATL